MALVPRLQSGSSIRRPPGLDTGANRPPRYHMCRHYQERGRCSTGDVCKFAHGAEELAYWNEHYAVTLPATGFARAGPPRPVPVGQQRSFATFALCRHFSTHGICRMGDQCRFAHGGDELNAWNAATGKAQLTDGELKAQVDRNLASTEARGPPGSMNSRAPHPGNNPALRGFGMGGAMGMGAMMPPGMSLMLGQQRPPQQQQPQQLRKPPDMNANSKSIPRYRLCEGFQAGNCRHAVCRFPHGEDELFYWRRCQDVQVRQKAAAIEAQRVARGEAAAPPPREYPDALRARGNTHGTANRARQVEIQLCPNHIFGTCRDGDSCAFAHSTSELIAWGGSAEMPNPEAAVAARRAAAGGGGAGGGGGGGRSSPTALGIPGMVQAQPPPAGAAGAAAGSEQAVQQAYQLGLQAAYAAVLQQQQQQQQQQQIAMAAQAGWAAGTQQRQQQAAAAAAAAAPPPQPPQAVHTAAAAAAATVAAAASQQAAWGAYYQNQQNAGRR